MGPETAFVIGAMLGAGSVLALRQFYRWLLALPRAEEDQAAGHEVLMRRIATLTRQLEAAHEKLYLRREGQRVYTEGPDGLRITPHLHGPRY